MVRRLLREVDIRITRCRFRNAYFCPRPDTARMREFKRFFRKLDLGDSGGDAYLATHLQRLAQTMVMAPSPATTSRALELGCYMQMAPALKLELGYREVRGAYLGPAGTTETKVATAGGREIFRCEIDLFDAERDVFPYPGSHFDLVLACEIIEHLRRDPMHMLLEVRRVLVDGGALLLTTPNCASLASVTRLLHGYQNPQIFSCYPHPAKAETDGPHVREYTPSELGRTLVAAGFQVETMFTDRIGGYEEGTWVYDLLKTHGLDTDLRGEQIYCLATKQSALPVDRCPSFLYGM